MSRAGGTGRRAVGAVGLDEFGALLGEALRGMAQLEPWQVARLYRHYELLVRWNRVVNLTGIRDAREIIERHFAESVAAGVHLPEGGWRVLDVGSGAGFPGIPLAVARPECRVTLAEARRRKAAFLREVTRDWEGVTVYCGRAEELSERFDWVVARAVAPREVLRLAERLGGGVLLLVGGGATRELGAAEGFRWEARVKLPWGRGRDRWLVRGLRV